LQQKTVQLIASTNTTKEHF